MSLGDPRVVDPKQARAKAKELLAAAATGDNPSLERKGKRQEMRFGELAGIYVQHATLRARPTTLDNIKRNLTLYAAPLAREPLSSVTRQAVHKWHTELGRATGPIAANRALSAVQAMFSWAMAHGYAPEAPNPASRIEKFPETPRDRVLSLEELRWIWRASGTEPSDRIMRLCMLTGCRRGEIAGVSKREIQGDWLVIPATRMKAGVEHKVYLTPAMKAELVQVTPATGDYLYGRGGLTPFDGFHAGKVRLDKRIAKLRAKEAGEAEPDDDDLEKFMLPQWGAHDVRRSFSTIMHKRRLAPPDIIERCLAHTVGSKVSKAYNHADYDDDMRAAWLAWDKFLRAEVI
jgi:integrase